MYDVTTDITYRYTISLSYMRFSVAQHTCELVEVKHFPKTGDGV